jgi:hypothetical protein
VGYFILNAIYGGLMFKSFYPTELSRSSYDVDYDRLYSKGIRGLIYDIDNTLVEHDADANDLAAALMKYLTAKGFSVCFISNNKEPRVKRFYDGLSDRSVDMKNIHYVYKAGKPSRRNYLKAMELMKTDKTTTCFIGDQLFTDVYGANRTGIMSILVEPIAAHEEIQIVLKRKLEYIVLKAYHLQKRKIMKDKNVVLIGFMGCGKSTVGRALEKKWGYKYLDMDAHIEAAEGMTINEIFASKGEAYFRELETGMLKKLAGTKRYIISTGGGTPLREENRQLLKELGTVIYLRVSPETVCERLKDDTTRPLLQRPDKEEAVRELLGKRKNLYAAAADYTISVDRKMVSRIVKDIEFYCR